MWVPGITTAPTPSCFPAPWVKSFLTLLVRKPLGPHFYFLAKGFWVRTSEALVRSVNVRVILGWYSSIICFFTLVKSRLSLAS